MFLRSPALAVLLLTLQLASADEPLGRVELSLNHWQETMERLARAELAAAPIKEPAAPCPAVISNVSCEVSYRDGQWQLTTDFEIEVLQDQWLVLPLADAALPLLSSQVSEGRITVKDGAYSLLTNKPGKIKVRLVQETPQPAEDVDFWLASATSIQAHLTTPGLHLTLNDMLLTSAPLAVASGEKDRTELHLRRTTAPVVVEKNLAPGVWESRSETQIGYEDGRLNYHHRVVLLCTSGNDTAATLTLPADCIVLGVTGDDLEKWEAIAAQDQITLQLDWKKAGARQRILLVDVARTQPNITGGWRLISPQAANKIPQPEVWQLTIPVGLRSNIPAEQPLAASLSNWMQGKLAENDAPVFQATTGSDIPVTPLKTVALAQARIETAKFSSELAAGGGMLSEAVLEIAASEKTTVDLQFEKDARIISCRVAGQRQSPVDLGGGRIQLNLPAGRDRITVELSFSQQLPAFDPASGQVRLTMPLTSLLTKIASWSIRLPAGLSLSAFDGSVVADTSGVIGELRFRQELYRDNAPLAVLFYQKKIK